ncbi:hypothetical protein ABBQ32_012942 [Trebouxia sp. C0010 RCD-2024]
MANRPTGVDEAIKFIWNQPDTVLQSSEKQRLSAALAKETDVVARRYFLAPLPEQWVGTLKELLAPTVQKDFYVAFKEKLKLSHITNPDAKAMERLLLNFSAQMQAVSLPSVNPDHACTLYRKVKDLPGTETCVNIAEQSRISINGPWLPTHPHLLTAVDLDSGSLLAFKLLPPVSPHQKDAAQSEKRAVKLLRLDTTPVADALVPTQIHAVKVSPEHVLALELGADSYDALRMPWYTASLHQLPQLSHELLLRGGRRLQQAVRAMHDVRLLHTDVKAANVFVDSFGAWFLGDFGASHMFEDKIKYCTEVTL